MASRRLYLQSGNMTLEADHVQDLVLLLDALERELDDSLEDLDVGEQMVV